MRRAATIRTRLALFAPILTLALANGCAVDPPSRTTLSGRRIRFTIMFRGVIEPNYYYFVLINNPPNAGQNTINNGPVAVGQNLLGTNTTYGNGFATGQSDGTGSQQDPNNLGFTDFVQFGNDRRYGGASQNGFTLYHVSTQNQGGENNVNNIVPNGIPVTPGTENSFSITGGDDPTSFKAHRLEFEIDLSQIATDASGNLLSNTTQTSQNLAVARAIRYLNVNVVATNRVPTSTNDTSNKFFDSFGDNRVNASGEFLSLDTSVTGVIASDDTARVSQTAEPADSDVQPANGASYMPLDLVSWQITVRNP